MSRRPDVWSYLEEHGIPLPSAVEISRAAAVTRTALERPHPNPADVSAFVPQPSASQPSPAEKKPKAKKDTKATGPKRDRSQSPPSVDTSASLYHHNPMTFRCPRPNSSTVPVDLRSDTFSPPTPEMRCAMAAAVVGDDVWEEDPTAVALEALGATLFGKEAALYVCSGTMGNLICMMDHCRTTPSEAIAGDRAHIVLYELGGISALGHAHVRQVPTSDDGTLPLDLVEQCVREDNVHYPITRVLALENTHNVTGGQVLPMEYVRRARALCDRKGIALHCDGARIWNAAAALGVSPATVAAPFDTMSICLSKGLGAPVGALVVGTKEFVARARKLRKMLGGGMRQVGMLAASGIYAIQNLWPRVPDDHTNATAIGRCLSAAGFAVSRVQSNIVMFDVGSKGRREAFIAACKARGVLVAGFFDKGVVRAVTHCGVSGPDTLRAIEGMKAAAATLK